MSAIVSGSRVLNLNPHFHSLLLDRLFVRDESGELAFKPMPPPTDQDIEHLTERLARRLGAIARRRMDEAREESPR